MKKYLLSIFTLVTLFSNVHSQTFQRKCGTYELNQKQYSKNPAFVKQHDELEQFTEQYIKKLPLQKQSRATIYKIPVVVHVVHNGEAVGTGTNISVAQVTSQITALNKDYRKLNADWANTPTAFKSLVADCEIEFCLATLSPTGSSTSGIDRINGGQADWIDNDFDNNVKPNTSWDNTKYLNIWICKFNSSMGGTLGYTTLPN